MKYDINEIAGVATQLVYEYPDWTIHHVSDMYNIYEECGETTPCDFDTFGTACTVAQRYKDEGLDYFQTEQKIKDNPKEILG